ncbi:MULTISPECIES: enoyl-CoA hydratase/isomerase family protein [Asticcacaulis]|uniref:enoyl-CoA hydratase/isomerase family protein n=1 Tax=Asticcacaulis TaxID=76890 RepID=UPI001AE9007D|nr:MULTISPECIES: enoyl-CoA hydratase/isomerase family protein [Asticcacaulis]MBP2161534.1 enoyl-CoA hydratase [Asticcacaulis solisilvae]MDR6802615.1 enoyl-CoA hydratase [Asticcacaulis sp. BE141]
MSEIITRVDNGIGRITLNRPKALHALTTEMCSGMADALTAWEQDEAIRAVLVDHAEGTRGFCAGGDIRKVAESGRKDGVEAAEFFRVEYTLNNQIKHYPKPYIAVMDGITMGGGVGISVHGSHRIVTERTIFAMPETGIGLFPDVGGGWFLPRLEGELGTWLALTGAQLRGGDVVAAGIGTHFLPSDRVEVLKQALASGQTIDAALSGLAEAVSHPSYAPHMATINRCFAHDTMAQISIALNAEGSEWALKQAEILTKRSPQSLAVALKQLREGRGMTSFEEVMKMEYRLACRITRTRDFSEGVRAVIEDKDNAPAWLASVDLSPVIEHMFDSLGNMDLQLP